MLNSLWGRLAIKNNKPKFGYVRTTERFNRIFYSNQYDMAYVNRLTTLFKSKQALSNGSEAQDPFSNVILASFVTSYARIEVYKAMNYVGPERLIYITNFVIALEGPLWPSLPLVFLLGAI